MSSSEPTVVQAPAGRPPSVAGGESDSIFNALRVVRERWWLVLAAVVLCAAIAAAASLSRPKSYEASAQVLFGGSQITDSVLGVNTDTGDPQRRAATEVLVMTSTQVAERVRRSLRTTLSADQLVSMITVEAEENADVLRVTAAGADPDLTARIANGFADQYLLFERDSQLAQINAALRQLQPTGTSDTRGDAADSSTSERVRQLQDARAAVSSSTEQRIGTAEVPDTPSSPNPKRDVALGIIIGLVLGVAGAFLIDLLDRRVRTADDFESIFDLPTLAAIPQEAFEAETQEARALAFEPYRVLRNSISYADLNQKAKVILITSSITSEGKTTVAMNLARAVALTGQPVTLVECDLRRPALARALQLEEGTSQGLTTALVGGRKASELLRPAAQGLRHFNVLPSGPLPPNAAELLRSARMSTILAELAELGGVVILDAPPLLPVADSQALLDLPEIDTFLLVARVRQTLRDEARRTRQIIEQHRLRPLGLVVTGAAHAGTYDYYGPDTDRARRLPVLMRRKNH